jgi:hypothetical protein
MLPRDSSLSSMPVAENTPLHLAILEPDQERVIELLHATDEATLIKWLKSQPLTNTPLLLAMKTGAFRVAAELILLHRQYQISLDNQDGRGMTALHWAAFFRNQELITLLLECGANNSLKASGGINRGELLAIDVYQNQDYIKRLTELSSLLTNKRVVIKEFSSRAQQAYYDNFIDTTQEISDVAYHMDRICINLLLLSTDNFLELSQLHLSSLNYFAACFAQGLPKLAKYLGNIPAEELIADKLRPEGYIKRLPSKVLSLHFSISTPDGTMHEVLNDIDVNNEPPSQIQQKLENKCQMKFRFLIFAGRKLDNNNFGSKTPQYEAAKDEDDPIHAITDAMRKM